VADYHEGYGEEEIESYYGEAPSSSSYYSKSSKYGAAANSSRAGGNEAAGSDSGYYESETYNGGNSRQYQESYSQRAKPAYANTNQQRSQAKYTTGGED
jgi:hypothetical protein